MGVVIAFPAFPAKSAKGRKAAAAGEVVIFPGVRIERREFTLTEARRLQHLPRVRANSRRLRRHPLAETSDN